MNKIYDPMTFFRPEYARVKIELTRTFTFVEPLYKGADGRNYRSIEAVKVADELHFEKVRPWSQK